MVSWTEWQGERKEAKQEGRHRPNHSGPIGHDKDSRIYVSEWARGRVLSNMIQFTYLKGQSLMESGC